MTLTRAYWYCIFALTAMAMSATLDRAEANDAKWLLWTSGQTQLRGANVYQQEAYGSPWCSRVESTDFESLRQSGANYVNLSIPGIFNVDPPYELNSVFMDELQRLVGFAKDHRLKVVIAFRTGPGRGEGDITESGNLRRDLFFDASAESQFAAMWKTVAQAMRDQTHVVGYDLLTEPTSKENDTIDERRFRQRWRDIARNTVAAIRSVDPHTPILIEPDGWASPESLEGWEPLYDRETEPQMKIVYAVHQYSPYEYTHENDPLDPELTDLENVFRKLKAFRDLHGVPLAINEFGVKFNRPGAAKFLTREFELLEQLGMNHAIWIWEPTDASCSGGTFDINVPDAQQILKVVENNWKKNE